MGQAQPCTPNPKTFFNNTLIMNKILTSTLAAGIVQDAFA